jgi:hypothetical protein
MRADARMGQRPVANLANVIETDAEVGKGTKEVVQPLPNPGAPVIVAGNGSEQRLDLATRVVERDEFVEVSTKQGIEDPASQLHALLRHRPPSICPSGVAVIGAGVPRGPPRREGRGVLEVVTVNLTGTITSVRLLEQLPRGAVFAAGARQVERACARLNPGG